MRNLFQQVPILIFENRDFRLGLIYRLYQLLNILLNLPQRINCLYFAESQLPSTESHLHSFEIQLPSVSASEYPTESSARTQLPSVSASESPAEIRLPSAETQLHSASASESPAESHLHSASASESPGETPAAIHPSSLEASENFALFHRNVCSIFALSLFLLLRISYTDLLKLRHFSMPLERS